MCLHINICVQKLGTADSHACAGFQKILGAFGQIDSQILNAVLVTAAVRDLAGVDGHSLLPTGADQGVVALFRHG